MNETRDRFQRLRELDPLDVLAQFPAESMTARSSSSPAARTVSSRADFLMEFPSEWQPLSLEPRTAPAKHSTPARPEAPADNESVVSSIRSGTSPVLRPLPPSKRWIPSLVLLLPSLVALILPSLVVLIVLRTPMFSTVAPLDRVQEAGIVGTVGPLEDHSVAPFDAQPVRVAAPPDTNDTFVSATLEEPAPRSSRPEGTAMETAPPAQSIAPVSVDANAHEDATGRATPVPLRVESSERVAFRGAISVESQPAGAQVSVDGRLVGVTPLVGWELPAGSHVVRIDHDGYDRWSAAIRVVTEQTVNLVTELQPTRRD